jgi:hypothetical protein
MVRTRSELLLLLLLPPAGERWAAAVLADADEAGMA